MTITHWLFSFHGRLTRRDFWIWMGIWAIGLAVVFTLAGGGLIPYALAGVVIFASLIPAAAVTVKRLHDRNKPGWWVLLIVPAWLLFAGNWDVFGGLWQWGLGRFIPTLITVMLFIDLGIFAGTQGDNRFGQPALGVTYR